jgi:hypothetical protein
MRIKNVLRKMGRYNPPHLTKSFVLETQNKSGCNENQGSDNKVPIRMVGDRKSRDVGTRDEAQEVQSRGTSEKRRASIS